MATEQEKEALYAMDISGVEWVGSPDGPQDERVEIAYLGGGAGQGSRAEGG